MKKISLLFLISFIYISCSKTSDQEYMNQANDFIKEKKIIEAVKSYETVLKEYPESKFAPKALVGLATIYESRLIDSLSSRISYEQASSYYYKVYEKYPKSEEAPIALFQAGFLQDDALKNYDEATRIYNIFLSEYPNHKHAIVVKQALDIMGIDPLDIISKSEAAKK